MLLAALAAPAGERENRLDEATIWLRRHHPQAAKIWQGWESSRWAPDRRRTAIVLQEWPRLRPKWSAHRRWPDHTPLLARRRYGDNHPVDRTVEGLRAVLDVDRSTQ